MVTDVCALLDWCFVHPIHIIVYFFALVLLAFFLSMFRLLFKL